MEQWQVKHIGNKLKDLIATTICTCTFLANLRSDGLISDEDVEKLSQHEGHRDRAMKFYQIIQTRKESYNLLKQALRDTCQTGAYAILNECNQHNNSLPYKNYGTISYCREILLGRGCYNTKVFLGKVEDRNVAVKLINTEDIFKEKAMKEVDLLKRLDWHENIVRYFRAEITDDFVLIAIELCDINLHDWVVKPDLENRIDIPVLDVLKQTTTGIAHLHKNHIVHRDLKPANILLVSHATGVVRVKISDFGLSKKIPDGKSRLSIHTSGVGTEGWMAPEIVRVVEEEHLDNVVPRISLASDIFSLGCIYYFVLTGGIHPFGGPIMRPGNILCGKHHLDQSQISTRELQATGFVWLIRHMVSHDDRDRPSASAVLHHHVFWPAKTTLNFLDDISPYIHICAEMIDKCSDLISEQRINQNWIFLTCQNVQEFTKSIPSFDGTKLSNLVQLIVSMKRNRSSFPQNVNDVVGNNLDDLFIYWASHVPLLMPIIWTCFQHVRDDRGMVAQYYPEEEPFLFNLMRHGNFILSKVAFPMNKVPDKLDEQVKFAQFEANKSTKRDVNSSGDIPQSLSAGTMALEEAPPLQTSSSKDETSHTRRPQTQTSPSLKQVDINGAENKPLKVQRSKLRNSFRALVKKFGGVVSLARRNSRDEKESMKSPQSSFKGTRIEATLPEKECLAGTAVERQCTTINKEKREDEGDTNSQLHHLHRAIMEQDEGLVKYLVENGADLNATNEAMQTPLHQACLCRDIEVGLRTMKYLIDKGADVMMKNEDNDTFLHRLLGHNPQTLTSQQFIDMLEYLLLKGHGKLFNLRDAYSMTPFQWAVRRRILVLDEVTLSFLHENGANFNTVDSSGHSVLFHAVYGEGSPECISNLIKLGADWKQMSIEGESILHYAAKHGTLDAVKYILTNLELDVNAVTKSGNTPLHEIMLGDGDPDAFAMISLLLEKGADVNIRNKNGDTPVELAVRSSWLEDNDTIVDLLLTK